MEQNERVWNFAGVELDWGIIELDYFPDGTSRLFFTGFKSKQTFSLPITAIEELIEGLKELKIAKDKRDLKQENK